MADAGDRSIPGNANPKCYAKASCECSAKVDDEHYVSENALEKITRGKGTIFVRNLGFQDRGVMEEKGISSLTSSVLCKHHNRSLSAYDNEFGKMVGAVEAIHECAGDKTAPAEHFFVDGDLIERCFLKTLCGGLYSGSFLVPPEDKMRGIEPPREWIAWRAGRWLPRARCECPTNRSLSVRSTWSRNSCWNGSPKLTPSTVSATSRRTTPNILTTRKRI